MRSFGGHLEVIWSSFGSDLEVVCKSSGGRLDVIWKLFGVILIGSDAQFPFFDKKSRNFRRRDFFALQH